jgi:hypothetical protein
MQRTVEDLNDHGFDVADLATEGQIFPSFGLRRQRLVEFRSNNGDVGNALTLLASTQGSLYGTGSKGHFMTVLCKDCFCVAGKDLGFGRWGDFVCGSINSTTPYLTPGQIALPSQVWVAE